MKVMFFCNLVPRKLGAFENYLIALGRGLRDGGDSLVAVFAAAPAPALAAAFQDAGISWHTIPRWAAEGETVRPYAFCLPAVRRIRCDRPDVVAVHFGDEIPSLCAILMTRLLCRRSPRWVWHQRQQIQDPTSLTARVSRIRMVSWGFHHFVVSYEGGRQSLRLRGIADRRITVIHNALADERPQRPADWLRRELRIPSERPLLVNVGWLVARKRIDWALRAFARASAERRQNAILLIVGDGPERERLQNLVSELGITDRVRFLGHRQDVREIVATCDFLVHASRAETCTNVVLEAMAAGKPVVMTDAGAAREQIEDGVSGFVVGPDDFEALTDRLVTLMNDGDLRTAFGRQARARWERMFRLETSVAKHCALYRQLAGSRG